MAKDKKYSLEELSLFFSSKGYITLDRFNLWFKAEYGFNDNELKKLWVLYQKAGNYLHHFREDEIKEIQDTEIIDKVVNIFLKLRNSWDNRIISNGFSQNVKDFCKIFYKEHSSEKFEFIEIDRNNVMDLVMMSKLLERGIDINICQKIDSYCTAKEEINFYQGDIFVNEDNFFNRNKHSIFIATDDGFRKLAYTKGLGYVNSDGDFNFLDKTSYNRYAVTCGDEWKFIGNIITHSHFLKD